MKPNLHVLAYHFGQKAEHCGSVGLETEQLIEGMHPFINRRLRQFCSIRDPARQMALVAQSQWVASAAHVPNGHKGKCLLTLQLYPPGPRPPALLPSACFITYFNEKTVLIST